LQAAIPGTNEVGMEGPQIELADKEQPVPETVLPAGVATTRTGLMGLSASTLMQPLPARAAL
jgi:hypothetical protein